MSKVTSPPHPERIKYKGTYYVLAPSFPKRAVFEFKEMPLVDETDAVEGLWRKAISSYATPEELKQVAHDPRIYTLIEERYTKLLVFAIMDHLAAMGENDKLLTFFGEVLQHPDANSKDLAQDYSGTAYTIYGNIAETIGRYRPELFKMFITKPGLDKPCSFGGKLDQYTSLHTMATNIGNFDLEQINQLLKLPGFFTLQAGENKKTPYSISIELIGDEAILRDLISRPEFGEMDPTNPNYDALINRYGPMPFDFLARYGEKNGYEAKLGKDGDSVLFRMAESVLSWEHVLKILGTKLAFSDTTRGNNALHCGAKALCAVTSEFAIIPAIRKLSEIQLQSLLTYVTIDQILDTDHRITLAHALASGEMPDFVAPILFRSNAFYTLEAKDGTTPFDDLIGDAKHLNIVAKYLPIVLGKLDKIVSASSRGAFWDLLAKSPHLFNDDNNIKLLSINHRFMDTVGKHGETPLGLWIRTNSSLALSKTLHKIIDAFYLPTKVNFSTGDTLAHYLAAFADGQFVLDSIAKMMELISLKNDSGATPLHSFATNKESAKEFAEFLKANKKLQSLKDDAGITPKKYAAVVQLNESRWGRKLVPEARKDAILAVSQHGFDPIDKYVTAAGKWMNGDTGAAAKAMDKYKDVVKGYMDFKVPEGILRGLQIEDEDSKLAKQKVGQRFKLTSKKYAASFTTDMSVAVKFRGETGIIVRLADVAGAEALMAPPAKTESWLDAALEALGDDYRRDEYEYVIKGKKLIVEVVENTCTPKPVAENQPSLVNVRHALAYLDKKSMSLAHSSEVATAESTKKVFKRKSVEYARYSKIVRIYQKYRIYGVHVISSLNKAQKELFLRQAVLLVKIYLPTGQSPYSSSERVKANKDLKKLAPKFQKLEPLIDKINPQKFKAASMNTDDTTVPTKVKYKGDVYVLADTKPVEKNAAPKVEDAWEEVLLPLTNQAFYKKVFKQAYNLKPDAIRKLIHDPRVTKVNQSLSFGFKKSPLTHLAAHCNEKTVLLFLGHPALAIKDVTGITPIGAIYVRSGEFKAKTAKILLKYILAHPDILVSKDKYGVTPLHDFAAGYTWDDAADPAIVTLLTKTKSFYTLKDKKGQTPCMVAITEGIANLGFTECLESLGKLVNSKYAGKAEKDRLSDEATDEVRHITELDEAEPFIKMFGPEHIFDDKGTVFHHLMEDAENWGDTEQVFKKYKKECTTIKNSKGKTAIDVMFADFNFHNVTMKEAEDIFDLLGADYKLSNGDFLMHRILVQSYDIGADELYDLKRYKEFFSLKDKNGRTPAQLLVREIVSSGADSDELEDAISIVGPDFDTGGSTLLHDLAEELGNSYGVNFADALKVLKKYKGYDTLKNKYGDVPVDSLFESVDWSDFTSKNNLATIDKAIGLGYVVDKNKNTILHELCKSVSNAKDLAELLKHPKADKFKNKKGKTPFDLLGAADFDGWDVDDLIEAYNNTGPSFAIDKETGNTLLHIVAENTDSEFGLKKLLGVPDAKKITNKKGQTPLSIAMSNVDMDDWPPELVKTINTNKKPTDIVDPFNKSTMMHIMAGKGSKAVIKGYFKLPEFYTLRDKQGLTPFFLLSMNKNVVASMYKDILAVKEQNLLSSLYGTFKNSILHNLAKNSGVPLSVLMQIPAFFKVRNTKKETPLSIAMSMDEDRWKSSASTIIKMIGTAPIDKTGSTVYHYIAKKFNKTDIVKYVKLPEFATLKNSQGDTPLHAIGMNMNITKPEPIIKLNKEADTVKNKAGLTPLKYAITTAITEKIKEDYGDDLDDKRLAQMAKFAGENEGIKPIVAYVEACGSWMGGYDAAAAKKMESNLYGIKGAMDLRVPKGIFRGLDISGTQALAKKKVGEVFKLRSSKYAASYSTKRSVSDEFGNFMVQLLDPKGARALMAPPAKTDDWLDDLLQSAGSDYRNTEYEYTIKGRVLKVKVIKNDVDKD